MKKEELQQKKSNYIKLGEFAQKGSMKMLAFKATFKS